MKKLLFMAALAFVAINFTACSNGGSAEMEDTDIVESGTYTGTASKVDPGEKEIYVKTGNGKMLELYFTDQTVLMQNDEKVMFSSLKKGQKVEVKVQKKGKRLEPMQVKIMN